MDQGWLSALFSIIGEAIRDGLIDLSIAFEWRPRRRGPPPDFTPEP
jgi:hypothetical protein